MDDDYNLDEEAIRDFTRVRGELLRVLKRNENLESYYFEDPGKHFSEDLRWLVEDTWLKENPSCLDEIHQALIRQAEGLNPHHYDVIIENHYRNLHVLDLIGDLVREILRRRLDYRLVRKMLAKEFKLLKKGDTI
jgi:hypothetical protein